MKIYKWEILDGGTAEPPRNIAELYDWFDSLIRTEEMRKQKPLSSHIYHSGPLFAGMPGLDKQKVELTIGNHRWARPKPIDWDAAAAMGLDERLQSVGIHPIRGATIHMAIIDDVIDEDKVLAKHGIIMVGDVPEFMKSNSEGLKAMATRAECKFCHKNIGVTVVGKLMAHGFKREEKVPRLDKLCKGSRMHVRDAVDEPVNDTRPCVMCGMPVVFAAGDLMPEDVLCPICLMPDSG